MAVSRAVVGVSPEISRQVVGLYRRVCREAPRLCALYELPMTPKDFRTQVNVLFREHRNVTEPRVVSVLLSKGEMEFEEAMNQWKQRSHMLTLLSTDLLNPELAATGDEGDNDVDDDFLDRLISGDNEREFVSAVTNTKAAAGSFHPLE